MHRNHCASGSANITYKKEGPPHLTLNKSSKDSSSLCVFWLALRFRQHYGISHTLSASSYSLGATVSAGRKCNAIFSGPVTPKHKFQRTNSRRAFSGLRSDRQRHRISHSLSLIMPGSHSQRWEKVCTIGGYYGLAHKDLSLCWTTSGRLPRQCQVELMTETH